MSNALIQRLVSTALAVTVSAAALWWLLRDGAGQALIEAVQGANLWPLALAALLATLIQIARAWRFSILASGNRAGPSWTMIGIATRLVLFNFILPFKLGELSFPVMMRRAYGTSFSQGAGILILCRLLDFGVVAAILLLTTAYLIDQDTIGWSPWIMTLAGLMILIAPILIAARLPWLRQIAGVWPRIERLVEKMTFGAVMMRPFGHRVLISILTCSIWFLHAFIAYLVAYAVDAGLAFLPMAMASAASNLAFALPISGVAGLGPPQAAWATMLHLKGIDWTPAITTALLCHGVLLITLSTWGLLTFLGTARQPHSAIDAEASSQGSP